MYQKSKYIFTMIAAATLVACGGGGGSGGVPTAGAQLKGVAAYGAPMAGATIMAIDTTGKKVSTIAAPDGSYILPVAGFTAPLLVTANGVSGDSIKEYMTLILSAPKAGEISTANVTPLTHALVAMASSDGASPTEFTDPNKLKAFDEAKLAAALRSLQTVLKDVLSDAGMPNSFNPITTSFIADRSNAADILLDTVKVTVSDLGVSLTNVRVPIVEASLIDIPKTVTVKGTLTTSLNSLPKPTVSALEIKGLDSFQAEINACLALAPTSRVSKDANGVYKFKDACDKITGFASNYKSYGYSLNQLWGARLLDQIPKDSTLEGITFLQFLDNGNKALVRLASNSSGGGRVYFETAEKISDGKWQIIGNQRNYDASIGVRMFRGSDMSTNGYTIPTTMVENLDVGKDVGKFDSYTSRLHLYFNQSGPNGADVYAVRIKGPGLPANGVVLARSTSCGTHDYLAFYSNNGVLPSNPTVDGTYTLSAGNTWTLDVANYGAEYKGRDFYNHYRGLGSTGLPSTSASNSIALKPVSMENIPEFALYSWEVFTITTGSTPAATFTSRIVSRPLAASQGNKLPWAMLSDDTLAYLKPVVSGPVPPTGAPGSVPINPSLELTSATIKWSLLDKTSPAVTSGYLYGTGNEGRMNMGGSVATLGDNSVTVNASAEFNGAGKVCSYAKVPTFTETYGYREVGLRQTTPNGLTLQSYSFHTGRIPNTSGTTGAPGTPGTDLAP